MLLKDYNDRSQRMGLLAWPEDQRLGQMDNTLINQWNAVVTPGSVVYHVGDFAFKNKTKQREYLSRMNGTKHLIKGNHDVEIPDDAWASVTSGIVEMRLELLDGSTAYIILCHWPFQEWQHAFRGAWHIHGHVHGELDNTGVDSCIKGVKIDVGADARNYRGYGRKEYPYAPFSLAELIEIMGKPEYTDEYVPDGRVFGIGLL
jgi:calcineurin-like phosphoesterase family protein